MASEEQSEEVEETEVDLDLDAQDATLRADTGKPTTVRWQGKVIEIPPMDLWEYTTTRKMTIGDYTGWAQDVLSAEDFVIWFDWKFRNYQIAAVLQKVTMKASLDLGKSVRSSQSSRGTGGQSKRTSRGGTR